MLHRINAVRFQEHVKLQEGSSNSHKLRNCSCGVQIRGILCFWLNIVSILPLPSMKLQPPPLILAH